MTPHSDSASQKKFQLSWLLWTAMTIWFPTLVPSDPTFAYLQPYYARGLSFRKDSGQNISSMLYLVLTTKPVLSQLLSSAAFGVACLAPRVWTLEPSIEVAGERKQQSSQVEDGIS